MVHIETMHGEEVEFECNRSKEAFKEHSNWVNHMEIKHSKKEFGIDLKQFKQNECLYKKKEMGLLLDWW